MFRIARRPTPLQVEQIADRALRGEGLIPIDHTDPLDIFVTGYPKSGNTWFQIMAAMVVFGADAALTPFTIMLEMIPDLSARKYYRRHSDRMVFKSHALPDPKHRRIVYLLRDGRDVMVSYKHYREIVDGVAYGAEEFTASTHPLWPCHWHEHVQAWENNPHGAEIMFIRYEDLIADTLGQLRRFCTFASLDRSDDLLRKAVASTSLAAMREKERAEGNWHPAFTSSDTFFRRGEVGSHRDEMPPTALAQLLQHAAPTLERHGYI